MDEQQEAYQSQYQLWQQQLTQQQQQMTQQQQQMAEQQAHLAQQMAQYNAATALHNQEVQQRMAQWTADCMVAVQRGEAMPPMPVMPAPPAPPPLAFVPGPTLLGAPPVTPVVSHLTISLFHFYDYKFRLT